MTEFFAPIIDLIIEQPIALLLFVLLMDLPRDVASIFVMTTTRLFERARDEQHGPLPPYTIVIPVLNDAGSVYTTIHQLRQQSVPPAKIFAINDGSTDMTAAVLRRPERRGSFKAFFITMVAWACRVDRIKPCFLWIRRM